jgi:hypothetical protein
MPGVIAADVFVHLGRHLSALSSSRERAGYVLAAGPDPTVATATAAIAAAAITIQTEQVPLRRSLT